MSWCLLLPFGRDWRLELELWYSQASYLWSKMSKWAGTTMQNEYHTLWNLQTSIRAQPSSCMVTALFTHLHFLLSSLGPCTLFSVAGRVPALCYHCSLECDKSSINASFIDTGTCIQSTYDVVEGGVGNHCKLPEKCVSGEHLVL